MGPEIKKILKSMSKLDSIEKLEKLEKLEELEEFYDSFEPDGDVSDDESKEIFEAYIEAIIRKMKAGALFKSTTWAYDDEDDDKPSEEIQAARESEMDEAMKIVKKAMKEG